MPMCPNCGEIVMNGDSYCPSCGTVFGRSYEDENIVDKFKGDYGHAFDFYHLNHFEISFTGIDLAYGVYGGGYGA